MSQFCAAMNTSPRTMFQAIEDMARGTAVMTFLDENNRELRSPFPAMRLKVLRFARQLSARGVRQGHHVGLIVPDPREFLTTFLALVRIGAVPVPMYPPSSAARIELFVESSAKILDAAAASVVLTSKRFEDVVWSAAGRANRSIKVLATESLHQTEVDDAAAINVSPPSLDEVCYLQFTSGSTADPKGVRITHKNLFANACAFTLRTETDCSEARLVSWLPLFHNMGLVAFGLAPVIFHASCVIIPTQNFLRDPLIWLDVLSNHKATLTAAPNFAYGLMPRKADPSQLKRWNFSNLKIALCGSEPIQAETMEAFCDHFAACGLSRDVIVPAYGMSEATLSMSLPRPATPLRVDVIDKSVYESEGRAVPTSASSSSTLKVVSCGSAIPEHQIAVFSKSGVALPERCVGEIAFRGPAVAAGYLGNVAASRETFREDGWLLSGDLGYLVDGEVFVSGRKKDLIIVNGKNVHPQAIEWEAERAGNFQKGEVVAFASVVGHSESVVLACEVSRERDSASRMELKLTLAKAIVEAFGVRPAEVICVPPGTLPKTNGHKVQRSRARRLYEAGILNSRRTARQSSYSAPLSANAVKHLLWGKVRKLASALNVPL